MTDDEFEDHKLAARADSFAYLLLERVHETIDALPYATWHMVIRWWWPVALPLAAIAAICVWYLQPPGAYAAAPLSTALCILDAAIAGGVIAEFVVAARLYRRRADYIIYRQPLWLANLRRRHA